MLYCVGANHFLVQFPFRWIYYYHSSKFTGKEIGKMHLCALGQSLYTPALLIKVMQLTHRYLIEHPRVFKKIIFNQVFLLTLILCKLCQQNYQGQVIHLFFPYFHVIFNKRYLKRSKAALLWKYLWTKRALNLCFLVASCYNHGKNVQFLSQWENKKCISISSQTP